jgi:acetylglutamate kinase
VKLPAGFQYSGVPAGLKPKRKDTALVHSALPCVCAGVVTRNAARAAPCIDAAARLPARDIHALVINSGNANALTGSAGLEAVAAVHASVAAALGCEASAVLSASTGLIGSPLPVDKIVAVAPQLAANLRAEPDAAAEAIMTTDTRVKMASRTLLAHGTEITIAAFCKGSGMIAPQLATMIAAITTDAAIDLAALQAALVAASDATFNRLTVDNDMSTNDCAFVMANGAAKNPPIAAGDAAYLDFAAALRNLCEELAREIAFDGEGATKRLEVRVTQAPTEAIAADLARAVAGSSLVKAAIFGADPNWGRILATVGARVGSQNFTAVNPYKASVAIQKISVYAGAPVEHDKQVLKARMREPDVAVEVACAAGDASATAWGCDLSYDYVKINADYSSMIVERAEGGLAKDDRLTNYSPSFKMSLLVEALGYIARFKGQRCVVKYGGAAMTKDTLKRSFCSDILLLRSVGLVPIVVHGGGPDITRALDKLGSVPQFVDGQRVTDAADLKVVEMVLTGSINAELVTLLNAQGAHAVGLSGKDAALLRAKKLVRPDGRDLGQVGELVEVNAQLVELMLSQGYVPVISPVGLGEAGASWNLNADVVAAGVAAALKAHKLIYLSDVAGILDAHGELISELSRTQLAHHTQTGSFTGGMAVKTESILRALDGGVEAVHVIDGRTPHSVIAELFTDRGVGTLVHAGDTK